MFLLNYKNKMISILDTGRIILFQCQIFGVAPVTIQKNKIKLSFFQSFINIFLALFMLISTFLVSSNIFFEHSKPLFRVTNLLLLISGSFFAIVVWICGIIHSKKLIVIFQCFSEFDYKTLFFKKLDNLKQPKFVWQQLLFQNALAAVQILTLTTVAILYFKQLISIELLRCVYLITKTTLLILIMFIINMIYSRFLILNNRLLHMLHDKKFRSNLIKYHLCKICEMHHLLSKTVKLFNETFGFVLLLFFGISFIIIVIVAFYLTGMIHGAQLKWINIIFLIVFVAPFIIDVTQLCHVCYKTIAEV